MSILVPGQGFTGNTHATGNHLGNFGIAMFAHSAVMMRLFDIVSMTVSATVDGTGTPTWLPLLVLVLSSPLKIPRVLFVHDTLHTIRVTCIYLILLDYSRRS